MKNPALIREKRHATWMVRFYGRLCLGWIDLALRPVHPDDPPGQADKFEGDAVRTAIEAARAARARWALG